MRALLLVTALGAGLLSCASPQHPTPRSPAASVQPARFVLVDTWAPLHQAPDDASPHLFDLAPSGAADARSRGMFHVFELVRERPDGWLEILSPPTADAGLHCQPGPAFLRNLRLRLFVRSQFRVPVVAREVRLDWKDGTRVLLHAGTPAVPVQGLPGTFTVFTGPTGLALGLRLRADEVANTYVAAHPRPPAGGDLLVDRDVVTSTGLRFGGDGYARPRAWAATLATTHVTREELRGVDDLVTLHDRCADLTALVPHTAVHPANSMLVGLSMRSAPPLYQAADATPVSWLDGSPAGRVLGPAELSHEIPSPRDGQRCFQDRILCRSAGVCGEEPELFLNLCLPAGSLTLSR